MTGEPTLHYGDQSADGWVEYAQELLLGVAPNIKIDGIFLDETIKAVYEFQQQNGLMVDGVVGNQTWSVLRGGEQAAVVRTHVIRVLGILCALPFAFEPKSRRQMAERRNIRETV